MKNVIRNKLKNWAESVDDSEVKKIILNKTILTGGAIVSMIQNETPKDFDIYFKDYDSTLKVANYYADKFNSSRKGNKKVEVWTPSDDEVKELLKESDEAGIGDDGAGEYDKMSDHRHSTARQIRYSSKLDGDRVYMFVYSSGLAEDEEQENDIAGEIFEDVYNTDKVDQTEEEKEKYRIKYISPNAITLSDKVQVIVRFYGEPDKVHETFDFVHTKAYYTSWNNELNIPKEVYEAIINKVLTYTGSRYPIASLVRSRKFIQRGWTINAGQYLKMAYQISFLDLDDLDVLRDQLVGVDSAYFTSLLDNLKRNREGNTYGTEYISKIIDKIF